MPEQERGGIDQRITAIAAQSSSQISAVFGDHVAPHSPERYVCALEVKRASEKDGRPDRRHVQTHRAG